MPKRSTPIPDDEAARLLLAVILSSRAPMRHVRKPPHSLAEAVRKGLVPKAYMPAAIEVLRDLGAKPMIPSWGVSDPSYEHNDNPWQQNAVRALEGD